MTSVPRDGLTEAATSPEDGAHTAEPTDAIDGAMTEQQADAVLDEAPDAAQDNAETPEGVAAETQEGVAAETREGVAAETREGVAAETQEGVAAETQEGVAAGTPDGAAETDEVVGVSDVEGSDAGEADGKALSEDEFLEAQAPRPESPYDRPGAWYVVHTQSGYEKKVKQNLEHRVNSLNVQRAVRQVVVPTESVQEMKDNQKVTVEKRTMPGYVLVNMDLNEDSWQVVKGTPGVTGFVGASNEPIPLTQSEVDRLLHREVAVRAPSRAQFSIGESVKVISGPLSDFSGEISEINEDAGKLKVLVSIFGRETPVEVGYDQVKKI